MDRPTKQHDLDISLWLFSLVILDCVELEVKIKHHMGSLRFQRDVFYFLRGSPEAQACLKLIM